MARAQSSDLLHNFRFQVTDVKSGGGSFLGTEEKRGEKFPQAGFSQCSMPSITVESATYREGLWRYTKKFPGIPTLEAITLQRGVAKAESALYKWVLACVKGEEYRADVTVAHFHRENDAAPARRIHLKNAFATGHKPGADLDANSSDVSIAEVTVDYESFDVEIVGGEKIDSGA